MILFEKVMELRAANPSELAYAVFDADNTIWRNDIANLVLAYMARHSTTPTARKDFEDYYALLDRGDAPAAYRFGATTLQGLSASEIYSLVQTAIAEDGIEVTTTELLGRTISKGIAPRKDIVTLMGRLRSCGIAVWVVSASPALLVRPGMEYFGIEADNVIGVRHIMDGSIVTAQLQEPVSIYEGKVACIKELVSDSVRPLLGAGDNMNDLPMLKYSRLRLVVDRGNELTTIAKERGWFLF